MPLDPVPSFSFSESDEPDGAVRLMLRGELDLTVVGPLRRRLAGLQAEHRAAVLDLSALEFLDSAGLMLFVDATNAARESGVPVLLTRPHGEVDRVLRLTGISELLRFRAP